MPFNSFNFWLIFPIIFIVYWAIPKRFHKLRNCFLVIVSYLLYMNWKPAFAIVLLGVTVITYRGGYFLDSQRNSERQKTLCWIFAILGLLPLLVFKYYNFLNESLTSLLSIAGLHFALPGLNWAIPVGISFFTFQAVGYMLDVYHGRCAVEKNFLDYALFVSFFPQVTSGPISTSVELSPQIKNPHTFDYEQAKQGLKYLLWGMFIKLVIADRLGMFVDTVYANYIQYNGATCFAASIFYTIQIYCDFAGYSLMAIGIARTLGFNLINNFDRPYFSASVTEFWKRWHISLTRWLTTHVYIGLGGNRCSKFRQYLNIMITFLVSGLWHGANWTFVVWGALHGLFQVIEKAVAGDKIKQEIKSGDRHLTIIRFVRIIVTFLLVSFAWIFFRMPTIGEAVGMTGKIFTDIGTPSLSDFGINSSLMAAVALAILLFKDSREEFFSTKMKFLDTKPVRFALYVGLFCLIIAIGVLDGGQFIYVSF